MKRSKSWSRVSLLLSPGKENSKQERPRPKKILYNIKPETKVQTLKKFWTLKAQGEEQLIEHSEKIHKKKLQAVLSSPFEEKAVYECIHRMLSSLDHPYGMVVVEFWKEIINSFEAGDMAEALAELKTKLESFSKSMAGTAFLQYKNILSRVTLNDFTTINNDALYEVLLSKEPNVILDYYHMKYYQEDHKLYSLSDKVYPTLTPASLDVQRKFCLTPRHGTASPPYSAAITIFEKFPQCKSPLAKIAVLKETAHSICSSVEQFWNVYRGEFPRNEDPSIAADDLVAIFSFIMLKSKVQLLYSESEYICDFLSERNLMGETGYLITTLQCCCLSLVSLDPMELMKT